MKKTVWNNNYKRGRYNKYPFSEVVSFVLSRYPDPRKRSKIKILDLGCGGGNHSRFLANEGFDVYAVDASTEAVNLTANMLKEFSKESQVKLANFKKLPFQSNSFDLIIDRQSLGHNPAKSIPAIIAEIHRVLKPTGMYLGFVFSAAHPHCQFGRRINAAGDMDEFESGIFSQSGLIHFFTVKEILNLFCDFRLQDVCRHVKSSLLENIDSRNNAEYFEIVACKS